LTAQSAMATFTRTITAAAGVFAPGHLGELTQLAPFELVDDVLARTGAVQRRLRVLPSRVGVYFLLALGLFPGLGYERVWAKLTAGLRDLDGLAVAAPSEKALRDLRRRLGPAPLKMLFEVLAGPLAWPYAPGVRFAGLRTVAFDGCSSIRVPDSDRNRAWLGRIRHRLGFAGYPLLHLMALAETGTRGLLGAVIGGAADGDEPALARGLLHLLGPGMLALMDRAFDADGFLAAVAGTGAHLLARAKATRSPLVLDVLPDGSCLAEVAGLRVRLIEAAVTVTGADGTRWGDSYRLITTLLDHRRFPAHRLVRLYHERWEIESAYYALRHTLLQGRVLRSGDRPGLEQETWALLATYQLLRMAMTDATATRPGTDPPRHPAPRRHRPRRPGHPAPGAPAPLQRPHRQGHHLPLPRPRRRPPPRPPRGHHRHRHHHPRSRPRRPLPPARPQTPRPRPRQHPRPRHRPARHHPPPPLDRRRTRRPAQPPPTPPAHPALQLGPHRPAHPHQPRNLHPAHPHTPLDKTPRPLTTRPWAGTT
jgi:Insertion element 4 transposase N-terminal/Transposase DDE domain